MSEQPSIHFSCAGDLRGHCGIKHRTLRAAANCCTKDHAGCCSQGGYSDRIPFVVVQGVDRALTADERDEFQTYRVGA